MSNPRTPGLFITGTDTEVGKTYIAAMIARALVASGRRVGVYKPVASGCRRVEGELVSDDAVALWEAAGRPGALERVCPQRFEAPLAPHLAARAEGKTLDNRLLRTGLDYWTERSDVVLVEGAGGLLCPLGEHEYVIDLARDFGFPLVVVAKNALGTINHTLQTLFVAEHHQSPHVGYSFFPPEGKKGTSLSPLSVAGVVLNGAVPPEGDLSIATNREELDSHLREVLLVEVPWQARDFDQSIDWSERCG